MDKQKQDDEDEFVKAQRLIQKRLKSIQQLNENLDQESRESIFKMPYSHLSLANSRGGKTFSLFQILKDDAYKILERVFPQHIFIISPTWKLDKTMRALVKYLVNKVGFDPANCFDDVQQGIKMVQDVMKQQMIRMENEELIPNILVIIDDCISEFKNQEFVRFIEQISTIGRHSMVSFHLLSQSHKSISNVVRRQCTHVQISQLNLADEMQSIADEFRGHMSKKQMFELINRIVNTNERNYLMICQQKPPSERYLINCSEVIII